jgi:hypothetical protein
VDAAGDLVTGIDILLLTKLDVGTSVGEAYVQFEIPALGLEGDDAIIYNYADWTDEMIGTVEIDNLALYAMASGFWRLKYTEIRLIVDGSTIHTISAGQLDNINFTPAGIPLLGIPFRGGWGSATNPVPVRGVPTASTALSDVQATANADPIAMSDNGYRFKENGVWYALPVNCSILGVPGVACDCDNIAMPAYGAPDSWSLTGSGYDHQRDRVYLREHAVCGMCTNGPASIPAEYDVFEHEVLHEQSGGQVTLLPSLTRSIQRLNSDYGALIVRGGLPEAKRTAESTCIDWETEDTEQETDEDIFFASYTELLSKVTSAAHTIEDPLAEPLYAPYDIGANRFEGKQTAAVLTAPGACPLSEPEEPPGEIVPCYDVNSYACEHLDGSHNSVVEDSGDNPYLIGIYDHDEAIVRYINFNASPHWQYGPWFPAELDEDAPDSPTEWKVAGERQNPSTYWAPICTQWIRHPALPEGENTETRNSIVSEPLAMGQLRSYWRDSVGIGFHPWGLGHLPVQDSQRGAYGFQDPR